MAPRTARKSSSRPQVGRGDRAKLNRAEQVLQNAELLSRSMMAQRLGMQFGGDRDLYSSFGYSLNPTYEEYRAHYNRQGLAARAVEIFADDTWSNPPILYDGEASTEDEAKDQTKFLTAWLALSKRLGVPQMMRQVDVMCGIGRYAVLFLGAPGEDLSKPAEANGVFYLAAFDEQQAAILKFINDPSNELYGMPSEYEIAFADFQAGGTGKSIKKQPVHYSRVIHVSENRLGSRVYGRPRLQTVLNRLFDLEKVTGGAAEAVWLSMYKGLVIQAREGKELPQENTPEGRALQKQVQDFAHKLQRFMVLENAEVKDLGVDSVRVKDTYDLLIEDFAGSIGVPMRILVGSERGELASSQDMRTWNGVIASRRTNFAEPEILYPFIDWCIKQNVLPAPESGDYYADWYPVYELNDLEQAQVALYIAQGANALKNGLGDEVVGVNEWRALVKMPAQPEPVEPGIPPTPATDATGGDGAGQDSSAGVDSIPEQGGGDKSPNAVTTKKPGDGNGGVNG